MLETKSNELSEHLSKQPTSITTLYDSILWLSTEMLLCLKLKAMNSLNINNSMSKQPTSITLYDSILWLSTEVTVILLASLLARM